MINAVGYTRFSTDRQTENSIKFQMDAIIRYAKANNINLLRYYSDVYNQRLIPFDTKKAVQTLKITAFEGKNANRKPLFSFYEVMMLDCWVHQCTQQIRGGAFAPKQNKCSKSLCANLHIFLIYLANNELCFIDRIRSCNAHILSD